MAAAVEIDAEIQQQLTNEVKLFNRWSFDDVSAMRFGDLLHGQRKYLISYARPLDLLNQCCLLIYCGENLCSTSSLSIYTNQIRKERR
ncbi:uncharacterized protein LOC18014193 isoform X2 [Eutrema salsugineum]|uniref:uncharacterized protein LOC18014193 isoform X2 n=1 Tax=Eutrema salsugineum TaxID=72664 RepID=UPI000CED258B|nr:uncharacterized protein LOC18014193 isoform X2 [Eutrema salsugineum]